MSRTIGVVRFRGGEKQALLAIERAIDDVACLLKGRDELAVEITIIFDDEKPQPGALSFSLLGRTDGNHDGPSVRIDE